MNSTETEVAPNDINLEDEDLIRQAAENADAMDAEQARSVVKSLAGRCLEFIGIRKAIAPKKDEEKKEDEEPVQVEDTTATPVITADDLDDSNAPEPAATPAEPEAAEDSSGAEPDAIPAADTTSGESEEDAKKTKEVKKALEDEETVLEVNPEENPVYDVEELLHGMHNTLEQATAVIQKSLEREESQDAVIQKSLAENSEVSNLKSQVNDLGEKIVELIDIVKALQSDRDSAPAGQGARTVAKSLADDEGSEPAGQGPLQGVAQRVQGEVEVKKAVTLDAEPFKRHGLTEEKFRANIFIGFADEDLRKKHGVEREMFDTVISKSFAEVEDKFVALTADAIATWPHAAR